MIQNLLQLLYRSRRRMAIWGVSCLVALMAYHAVFGANGLVVYGHKRSEAVGLQEQIQSLKRQNARMETEIRSLESDPQTIEREAREQLRYVRPKDTIYTLPQKPEEPVRTAPAAEER